MNRIAVLIPTTSKGDGSFMLHKKTLKTIDKTKCEWFTYDFYIGVDHDETKMTQEYVDMIQELYPDFIFNIHVFEKDIEKGHLSRMWNVLGKLAYTDGHEYYFQCGDDLDITTGKGWTTDFVEAIESMYGLGLTGHNNEHPNEPELQTQAFFGRKHLDIFGFVFPPRIKNWYCDSWLTYVYSKLGLWRRFDNHEAINTSFDNIRYNPKRKGRKLLEKLVVRDACKIQANLMNELINNK